MAMSPNISDREFQKFIQDLNGDTALRTVITGGNITGFSTSAKQDALKAAFDSFAAAASTSALQSAGNNSLASIFTAMATASKQDTGNASAASIDGKLSLQATAAKQDALKTAFDALAALVSTAAAQAAALSEAQSFHSDNNARIGALTEAAPASDTASSGVNGRLQRIAQNLTTGNASQATSAKQDALLTEAQSLRTTNTSQAAYALTEAQSFHADANSRLSAGNVSTASIDGKVSTASKQDALKAAFDAFVLIASTAAKQDTLDADINSFKAANHTDLLAVQTKQDTGNTSLASILAAIATAAKQDLSKAVLDAILTALSNRTQKSILTDGTSDAVFSNVNGTKALQIEVIRTVSALGSGVSQSDNTAVSLNSTAFTPAGGLFNDSAPDLLSGNGAYARMTKQRAMHSNPRDSAGVEILVATSTKQDTGNVSLASIDVKLPAKGAALIAGSTPVNIASDQMIPNKPYDVESGNYSRIDQNGRLRVTDTVRLIGGGQDSVLLDARVWSSASASGGTITNGGSGICTLASGTTSGGAASIVTLAKARFINATVHNYLAGVRVDQIALIGNTRRWGVFTATDGIFFELKDGVIGVITRNSSVDTRVTSFNGTTAFVLDTNFHVYEINYSYGTARFYQDGKLIHKVTALTDSICDTMNLPAAYSTLNTAGTLASGSLYARGTAVNRLGNDRQRSRFFNGNAAATTVLKSTSGTLRKIIMNRRGTASATLTIYDNTAGSGTVIATLDLTVGGPAFEYDIDFTTGLTIVGAGVVGDFTVVYD